MLSYAYYASNYAGIIGTGLRFTNTIEKMWEYDHMHVYKYQECIKQPLWAIVKYILLIEGGLLQWKMLQTKLLAVAVFLRALGVTWVSITVQ